MTITKTKNNGSTSCEPLTEHLNSATFRATRQHHLSEAAQDYTELIFQLSNTKGEARTGEIAKHLGISHVTALRTLKRLQTEGYVTTKRGHPVKLTAKGIETARHARERHELLVNFFVKLGVPRNVAEIDVEGAEHHISNVTLKAIRAFMR